MAHTAIGQLRHMDVVARNQRLTNDGLIRRLPGHVKNLRARPDEPGGIPVALETPFHVQRMLLPGERHLIDATVAGFTADSLADVDAVVEENEVRQIVNPLPTDRATGGQTFPDRCQQRSIRP